MELQTIIDNIVEEASSSFSQRLTFIRLKLVLFKGLATR